MALISSSWSYGIAGLVVGLIIGITGVGGGSLMTPLLILYFKVNPVTAVITDLFYAAITKSMGLGVYAFKKLVQWRIVGLLLLGSIPSSILTLIILNNFYTHSNINSIITKVLGFALILTSVVLLLKSILHRIQLPHNRVLCYLDAHKSYLVVILGLILGGLVTISSVGAGALGLAFISLIYKNYSMAKIVAIDLAHAVILSSVAGIGHLQTNSIDMSFLIPLLAGSIPGVILGSFIGSYLSERIMRPLIGCVLLILGLKFVLL